MAFQAVQDDISEKTATQCCHADANRIQATWAGMGGGQDLRTVARDTLWEGRQAGSSSVLDQIQPRLQSNSSTSVPIQEKRPV